MRIRFTGINADPGQFEIKSGTTTPLTGDNVAVAFSTPSPYGTNLFYAPVPFEFLKTYEEKPQVLVSVDGEPAVCHNMTCDFTYVEAAGEVTAATFDPATKKLVITGTALPTLTPPAPATVPTPTVTPPPATPTTTNTTTTPTATASTNTTTTATTSSTTTATPPSGRRRRLQPEVAPVLSSHRRWLTAN